MTRHQFVSGLSIEHKLMYRVEGVLRKGDVRRDPLPIQQSELDRSCGLSCVLMAAMLINGWSRERAISVAWSVRPELRRLWAVAKPGYFRGVSPSTLVRQLEVVCPETPVDCSRGKHSALFDEVARAIEADHLPLVMIGTGPRASLHWVLIVGVEFADSAVQRRGAAVARPSALLGLDPESPPPVCSAFNWRMPKRLSKRRTPEITTTAGTDVYRDIQRLIVLRRRE